MHMISTKNELSLPFANHPKLTSPACEVLGYFMPMNERDIIY